MPGALGGLVMTGAPTIAGVAGTTAVPLNFKPPVQLPPPGPASAWIGSEISEKVAPAPV